MEPILSCPHPRKVRFPNAREACESLEKIKSEPPREGDHIPITFYECRCGFWHLSSTPPPPPEIARKRGMPPAPGQHVPDRPEGDA